MRARHLGAGLIAWAALATAGCGLTLDVDPQDPDDAGLSGLDGGGIDAGTIDAGPECTESADCDDGLFCNGEEACEGGACVPGEGPCAVGDPCQLVACKEELDLCETRPVECDTGMICDPSTGCVPAPDCTGPGDCPDDGIACNGTVECTGGTCTTGPVVACEDGDGIECTVPTCAIDGCVELGSDALCPDEIDDDCMVPHCSGAGCTLVPAHDRCDDGLACTVDRCVPPTFPGNPGRCTSVPATDPAICDDGVRCTVDTCSPTSPTRDGSGCVHAPNDDLCAPAGTTLACGANVCAGADALGPYPTQGGCAPNLDSGRCAGVGHCVPGPGGPLCVSFADGCALDRDCDDGNPCNGIEGCRMGLCTRISTGCPEVSCGASWCDLTTTPPSCRVRIDPICAAG